MSGAAAWTKGQEVGGRDRNHSPGRPAGPQQLVAARSYPKFVYSYTSLAKPLEAPSATAPQPQPTCMQRQQPPQLQRPGCEALALARTPA
ncbi:hypothetical protein HaLaN_28791 [Haematococcus lacustris]|uniref:Uncharacterized protein n=1 Tax=Haematococcus lacustris TaxID=44745 RepID=A0A6A0ACL0_HAELA|nr:hypothetical protein HaLaN_28791 [Haematococcus lacustris]